MNTPAVAYLVSSAPIAILVIAGLTFVQARGGSDEVMSRLTELFNLPLLIGALEYRFVQPAIVGGYELTIQSFLIGEGIGFEFYVPWFDYRGLDPWHFSVDSLFAFAFFKYGILGLIIWVYAVSRVLWFHPLSIANAWIWLYWFVHSGVNVPSFLLFMVVLVILRDGSWLQTKSEASGLPEEFPHFDHSTVVGAQGNER